MRPTLVRVSDYCKLYSWYDAKSELWFSKADKSIIIPETVKDLSNINRYINMNILIDLTEEAKFQEEINYKSQVTNNISLTPNQLVDEVYTKIEVSEIEEDEILETEATEETIKEIVEEVVEEAIEPVKKVTSKKKRR